MRRRDAGVESPAKRRKWESDEPQFHVNDNNRYKLPASFESHECVEGSTPSNLPSHQITSPFQPDSYGIEKLFPCASKGMLTLTCYSMIC